MTSTLFAGSSAGDSTRLRSYTRLAATGTIDLDGTRLAVAVARGSITSTARAPSLGAPLGISSNFSSLTIAMC